jgi:dethiobiotin synthetase
MSAFFITATGTDIGKTFVTAGLIRHWRALGREVDALKPVATGFNPDAPEATDTGILLASLGRPTAPAEIDRVTPWRFVAPLSPDMAARREQRLIDFDALVDFCRRAVAKNNGTLLIEGIGGIMVPLDNKHTVLDWMLVLQIPLVLVTGTYLGSLSHTLTCLEVLARRGLVVKSIIVNDTPGSTVTMQNTSEALANFAGAIPIVGVRRLPPGRTEDGVFRDIAKLLET